MKAISLQSGSNGNSIYVEAGKKRLLFDAGISGIQAQKRLAQHGRDIRDVDAVLISHDHSDHVRCAGVYARKYGLQVRMTEGTYRAASRGAGLGKIADLRLFEPGEPLSIGDTRVETVPTPHDGSDGVVFAVEAEGRRLGILTDLGHVFDGLGDLISTLDAVFLESNYDPDMLQGGPYPPHLKRRIKGKGGHISNEESAELLWTRASSSLKWACLAHLSEMNNTPELALATHQRLHGDRFETTVAGRYGVSDILELE